MSTSFPPETGGVATLLGNVARSLRRAPVILASAPARQAGTFDLNTSGRMEIEPYEHAQWVESEHRSLRGRAGYRVLWSAHPCLYYLWHFWRPALRLAAAERVAVVQSGHIFVGLLALALKLWRGLPYVLYAHAQEIKRSRTCGLPPVDRLLRGWVLRHASAVFVLSEYTRTLVLEWQVDPLRVVRLPVGGLLQPPHPQPGRRSQPSGQPVLLTVARLVPRKGVDTVIAALPRVLERYPNAQYVVAGTGPDDGRLRRLVGQAGLLEHVLFAGAVDAERLASFYAACDLFVMPAREAEDGEVEGFGLVFLEAAAYGKPAVAGRSGGMADAVLDGVTGVLVDPTDAQALAVCVLSLLDDAPLLARMGRAARHRVEGECTWQHTGERVAAVLDRVARGELPS